MNRVIFFSGQKGGVGRSTLAELYANYLVEKRYKVTLIDADIPGCGSIYMSSQRYLGEVPFNVVPLDVSDYHNVETARNFLDNNVDTIYIVDCRFNHDYNNLLTLYESADMIVLPILYDRLCPPSTTDYMEFLRRKGIRAPFYLLPNMCRESREPGRSQILGQWGEFLPEIPENAVFQNFGCFDSYTKKIERLTAKAFDAMTEKLKSSVMLRKQIATAYENADDFEERITRHEEKFANV